MTERPTIRPVTLPRLVELTNACETDAMATEHLETALDVSHRRARETILEAVRIGLLCEQTRENDGEHEPEYATTEIGSEFLEAVSAKEWRHVSEILQTNSPHYGAFLEAVAAVGPTKPGDVLDTLEAEHDGSRYDFNQTSIDVIGDWGERLGAIQRNAFTGSYYRTTQAETHSEFQDVLLSVFDELEETAGVNLSQRYLSIPKLREYTCEQLQCTRRVFDDALLVLARQNVGRVELSGAPMDTGAKDAALGIKQIELAPEGRLVSTDQSTERVMTGVEQYGKQYYYLAIHDENITYTPETES